MLTCGCEKWGPGRRGILVILQEFVCTKQLGSGRVAGCTAGNRLTLDEVVEADYMKENYDDHDESQDAAAVFSSDHGDLCDHSNVDQMGAPSILTVGGSPLSCCASERSLVEGRIAIV